MTVSNRYMLIKSVATSLCLQYRFTPQQLKQKRHTQVGKISLSS